MEGTIPFDSKVNGKREFRGWKSVMSPENEMTSVDKEEIRKAELNSLENIRAEIAGMESPIQFQRKIIPWELQRETAIGNSTKSLTQSCKESDVVVVATLIDKPANLGGLCRTCEVLSVSTLVVDNLNIKGILP